MELVYLWVEKYKNIEKQGFNFSPRFRCEYDAEKNELNIIDKDETGEFYPKNFFGDNINITAIVGENGSGKSGILSGLNQIIAYSKDNNIVIFRLNDKLYCNKKCAFNKNIEILTEKVLLGRKNKYFSIITHTSDFIDSEIFLDRELSIYKEVHPMAIRDYDINSLNIMFMHLDLNYSNYLSYIQKLVFIMLINRESKIFFPNKYKISLHANFLIKKLFDISLYYPLDQDEILKNKCENYIYKLISKNDIDYIINFYFFMKKYSSNDKKYLDLVKYFSAEKFLTIDMLNISNDENIIRNKFLQVYTQTEDWINISLEKRNILNILFKCDKFSKMIIELFYIDLHDGIKSFSDLSTGEREYLLTEALIVEKINEGNFLFLLDEIDSSFHPNWSKELINNLIKTVSKHKVHIIISSHSPFLLSDLPKENVIFLEKDEKTGKCVNATEKMKDFSTFGANIHTLLSHGFFMKGGLIGEFAKEKIDLAIKYLNQKILTEDELNYCENIISIIGEPIIKRELQRKLDSKRLSKIDKIEEIEEQMKLLQNRLEMIRKNQK
ncbi:ATP-binding protein [Aliarcobacter butzleri]|uniref:ATP-binding protein n=1 Tax=Aliarcobacter butzleri TaxID=28197 RepID=UPI0021B2276C|nr:ATP-binding protein [Aliarcobacter butzleri]UXC29517.1 ATP-binding protein [Aliarcobacter butzleri]